MAEDISVESPSYVEFSEFYKRVGGVQFSLLSNQETINLSSVEINDRGYYDQTT